MTPDVPAWCGEEGSRVTSDRGLTLLDSPPAMEWIALAPHADYLRGLEAAAGAAYARCQQYAAYQVGRPSSESADAESRLYTATFLRDECAAAIRALARG